LVGDPEPVVAPDRGSSNTQEEFVEQHRLHGQAFRLAAKVTDGALDCMAIPKLVMPVRAAFDHEENL
jgi:hypothetical protein